MIDPQFPDKLAAYARAVARRYPWVESYTPRNEPLTTARFSGLYGLWYLRGRDNPTFVRALLTQCRAVVLAMAAICEVNPQAKLVQTDDLGKTWSTPRLAEQAAFENERRWLSFDLLCGRVSPEHPLWHYLRHNGATEAELHEFLEQPCPADIIGINHYLSGERFLDERAGLYPDEPVGGNGHTAYVDVLAARVLADGVDGPEKLLHETWRRYGLPIAVTEAHNGCTREEQLRWLRDVWDAAQSLRSSGVDLRAVMAWSLLGCYDWNRMVTTEAGHYEPGVFDLRGLEPRPTALAPMLRSLAAHGAFDHPVLAVPGWWQRPDRLISCVRGRSSTRQAMCAWTRQNTIAAGATATMPMVPHCWRHHVRGGASHCSPSLRTTPICGAHVAPIPGRAGRTMSADRGRVTRGLSNRDHQPRRCDHET